MTDRHRVATRSVHKTLHRQGQSSDGEQDVLLPRRRSQSVKKRDASWDKKWSDRQQTEEFRLRRPWTMPGKLNTDFWESCRGENIPHIRSITNISTADSPCNNGTTVAKELSSDMSAHQSDDLITIFTTGGKDNPRVCQDRDENISIRSQDSQDTVRLAPGREGGDQQENTAIDNLEENSEKEEIEAEKTKKMIEIQLDMESNNINEESPEYLDDIRTDGEKGEKAIIIESSAENERIIIDNKLIEKDPDSMCNKLDEHIIEVDDDQEKEQFMSQLVLAATCDLQEQVSYFCTGNEIPGDKIGKSDAENDITSAIDPDPEFTSLCLDQPLSTSPATSGLLILAAQDMTTTLSDILSTITATPPSPSPTKRESPLINTLQPATIPASYRPELIIPAMNPYSENLIAETEDPPPRPPLPAGIIEDLEKKIEIKYKKYPKFDQTPPRTPLPPERSDSQGKLKSANHSPQTTPNLMRKHKISQFNCKMHDTANIQISDSYPGFKGKNADSLSKSKIISGTFKAKPSSQLNEEKDIDMSEEKKSKEDIALKLLLEKEQKDVESILRRKKEAEHLKRLEFEENRIKEENEKLKLAAEEKKKREEEDARRLQEEAEKTRNQGIDSEKVTRKAMVINLNLKEEKDVLTEDNQEEEKIRIGREEAFKELENQKRKKAIKRNKSHPLPDIKGHNKDIVSEKNQQKVERNITGIADIRNKKEEVTPSIEDLCDQNEFKDARKDLKIKTHWESKRVKCNNGMIQNPKTDEKNKMVFKDISNVTSFSVFNNPQQHTSISSSRRWKDVHTGYVKDRANTYEGPEKEDNKNSLKITRSLSKSRSWSSDQQVSQDNNQSPDNVKQIQNDSSEETENDDHHIISDKQVVNTPWRRNTQFKENTESVPKSPSLNLVSITITPSSIILPDNDISDPDMMEISNQGIYENSWPSEDVKECEYSDTHNVVNTNNGNINNNVKKIEQEVGTQDTSLITKLRMKEQDAQENQEGEIVKFGPKLVNNITEENNKPREDFEDSEYDDDFSVGIDLPVCLENTSVSVTPIPTTGELEKLNHEDASILVEDVKSEHESRRSSLKSLLKKPSIENPESSFDSESDSDFGDDEANPKKVHFCDVDQVKMMSQDSLASLATSEGSVCMPNNLISIPHPPSRGDTVKLRDLNKVYIEKEKTYKEDVIVRKEYIV